jgi:hypothetical protein
MHRQGAGATARTPFMREWWRYIDVEQPSAIPA